MIQAVVAAIAAIAALGAKAANDAKAADEQSRARKLQKQQTITGILQSRAQMGGADTLRSTLASRDQEFLRNLAANRRDTSGDLVPFVNALGGVAQGIASDVGSASTQKSILPPQSTSTPAKAPTFEYPSYGKPVLDEDERDKFLASLATKGGWYS